MCNTLFKSLSIYVCVCNNSQEMKQSTGNNWYILDIEIIKDFKEAIIIIFQADVYTLKIKVKRDAQQKKTL